MNTTRREFLRRSGVVAGATLWATPVVQSVVAPAWAVSGPPGNKPVCTPSDEYVDKHGHTVPCGVGCKKGCPAGYVCRGNSDCQTRNCLNGRCAANGAGGVCTEDRDCRSKHCGSDGICEPAFAGEVCVSNSDCTTGVCAGGVCAKSARNGTCAAKSDCIKGLKCRAGTCG